MRNDGTEEGLAGGAGLGGVAPTGRGGARGSSPGFLVCGRDLVIYPLMTDSVNINQSHSLEGASPRGP